MDNSLKKAFLLQNTEKITECSFVGKVIKKFKKNCYLCEEDWNYEKF